ncbi:MAG TPA: hypothetical protein VLD18_08620 [Verrucomicrobiae bacterium]|nr:hypothetical protein [Verrucomicrobiae bacterium]
MTTRKTVSLISFSGVLVVLFATLGIEHNSTSYLIAAGLSGMAGLVLMINAGTRETTTGDKSPTMTPKQIAIVLTVIVSWLVLILFNEGLFGLPAESELNDSTPVTRDEAR